MITIAIAALSAFSLPNLQDGQREPPSDQRAIIIEAEREKDQRRRIGAMVRAFTDIGSQGQIPQFDDPICPLAIGFGDSAGDRIEARLRKIGDAIELGSGEPDCRANLLIVGTSNRDAILDYWEKKQRNIFWGLDPKERAALRKSEDALIAWQLVNWFTADGLPVDTDPVTGIRTVEMTMGASRLKRASRPSARSAVVVVDIDRLEGIDSRQLADHVAMRALAPIDPEATKALSSRTILHLLDAEPDDVIPLSMTEWDFAFLKALYATDNLTTARAQRRSIRRLVDNAVSEAAEIVDEQ